jgi:hypothetical protein
MLLQGATLTELSNQLADFSRQAAQEPLSKLLKPNESVEIEKLKAEIDSLATAPVPERGDVTGQISQFKAEIYGVENDLKEAQDKADAIAAAKAKADAEVAQRGVRAKGMAYASESGTIWKLTKANDEMTDKTTYTAISVQIPTPGVEAEITATCSDPSWLEFEALIVDESGHPTVEFPGFTGEIGVMELRKNEEQSTLPMLNLRNIRVTFSNKFRIGVVPLGQINEDIRASMKDNPLIIDLNTTWKYVVKIETSAGPAVLKIPLFADEIQKAISECK